MRETERGKRSGDVIVNMAELFDLPEEAVTRLPHVELAGSRQLYVGRHQGILSYSDTGIDINTACGILQVRGGQLSLVTMTAEELLIRGQIDRLEWVK